MAQGLPVKDALDRGGFGLSRVRTLEISPIPDDPPGAPAYALISSASVILSGGAERCRVTSASGEGPEPARGGA